MYFYYYYSLFLFLSMSFTLVLSLVGSHSIVKRQTTSGNAPTFSQSSYSFTLSSCNAGTLIGTIYATNPVGGQVGYTIDPASVQGYFAVLDYLSGTLTLATNLIYSSATFNVRAANSQGISVVPVTITCSALNNGFNNANTNTGFVSSNIYSSNVASSSLGTQTVTGTNCVPGGVVGNLPSTAAGTSGYTISGNNQFIINANTGQILIASNGIIPSSGTYSATVQAYTSGGSYITIPVQIILSCYGSTGIYGTSGIFTQPVSGTFTQSSYYFTTSSCYAGSSVGTVFANGATNYYITNGNGLFTVSPSGLITMTSSVPAGTYSLTIQSTSTYGSTASVPVTISVACSGTTTGTGFGQSSYSFSTSTCTSGSSVGSVYANGATSYYLTSGTGQFSVSTGGLITLAATLPAGTYSTTVSASGSFGSSSVPVTITVSCSGTGTSSGNGVTPTFNQPYYAFTLNSCNTFGTTSSIGAVTASGATSYSVNYGSGNFSVDNNGNLSATSGLSAGRYSVTVVATGSNGAQISVPVTVTVSCVG